MSNSAIDHERGPNWLDEHPFDLNFSPLPENVLVEDIRIPMSDGVMLAATLYRPRSDEAVPVIATATPYGKDEFEQWNNFRDAPAGSVPGGGFYFGEVNVSDHTAFEAPDPGYWVLRGYAVVLVDYAGTGQSQSAPPGKAPSAEQRWYDTFEWLAQQTWSTGHIGMLGVSALCITQWKAASSPAHPALKAIIPWEGINATGPGNGYGGIPETAFPDWIARVWVLPNVNPAGNGPEPMLLDWTFDCSKIRVPALVCASTSDQELHCWDTFDAYTLLDTEDKWLVSHRGQKWGEFYGESRLDLQYRFFERFLKGRGDAFKDVPRVSIDVHSDRFTKTTRHADAWPLPGTRHETLYPDAASKRIVSAPPAAAQATLANGGPETADSRLLFDYLFEETAELIGHSALYLSVAAQDTPTIDLFVAVEKLDANGDRVYFFSASGGNANGPATRGWLRSDFRAIDEALSRPERPVRLTESMGPLPDSETVELAIPLMPMAVRFHAGDTLRLVVQTWSVKDCWEGGECRQWDTVKEGGCIVQTGADTGSRLLLPFAP